MKLRRRIFWLWCTLLFGFGYLVASWAHDSIVSGPGLVPTIRNLATMVLLIAVANAKVLIVGPMVFSIIKDITHFFFR